MKYRKVCGRCKYDYESVLEFPKSCPRCKARFDYGRTKQNQGGETKQ